MRHVLGAGVLFSFELSCCFGIGRILLVCYIFNELNMFTHFFLLVRKFQLRRLLHKHRIYAPESDPGLDMHIHYYPRHPIYMLSRALGTRCKAVLYVGLMISWWKMCDRND